MKNIDFFKSLDEMLRKQIDEGVGLNEEQSSCLVLQEIAKFACQMLQYRKVMYQLQLATEIELKRCLYFTGIEEILATIYEDFYSLSLDKKIHLYTKALPKPKGTASSALKAIQEKLPMLQTNWFDYYKEKA